MASSSAASGFGEFGTKLYGDVASSEKGKNVFLSPASIALAMAMCSVGARKATQEQMLNALGFKKEDELVQASERVMAFFTAADKDKLVKLKLANRLYAQKDYVLEKDYLNIVQKSFAADVKLEDFQKNGAKAVSTINGWVEDQTNKLIKDLLSVSDVPPDTRLILINCIYFKGTWLYQFKEEDTNQSADFHGANGTTTKVKLMYQKSKFAYADNQELKAQVAHLPYKSSDSNVQFVFTAILPHEGVSLESVEKQLTQDPSKMSRVLSTQGTSTEELLLYLPKFKLECSFELNAAMIKLGMSDAFDGSRADFSGIVARPEQLVISKVIHKAFVEVNEEGSEAAAATAVVLMRCCASINQPKQPIVFKADRPFLFSIQETRTGVNLFMGKFTQ